MILKHILNKPQVIGIIGDVNSGKSMVIYNIIEDLSKEKNFNFYHYGLKVNFSHIKGVSIQSVKELEIIKDSLIIADEFFTLFDLDNRKARRSIEKTLRLINHKNNILILAGVGENFKKFISNKLNIIIYKQTTFGDLINGSKVKNVINDYNGEEKGSEMLNLEPNEALVYDCDHYYKTNIPYLKEYDTKLENVPIFIPKSVRKIVQKEKPKEVNKPKL